MPDRAYLHYSRAELLGYTQGQLFVTNRLSAFTWQALRQHNLCAWPRTMHGNCGGRRKQLPISTIMPALVDYGGADLRCLSKQTRPGETGRHNNLIDLPCINLDSPDVLNTNVRGELCISTVTSDKPMGVNTPKLAEVGANPLAETYLVAWNLCSGMPAAFAPRQTNEDSSWILEESEADVLGVTELWLKPTTHTDSSVAIDGYHLERRDGIACQGGGVAVYLCDSVPYRHRCDLQESAQLEDLWVEIKVPHTRGLLLCTLYRPPDSANMSIWYESMEQTLETTQQEQKEVIIMGDINIDWLDEQAKEEEWQRVVETFQMTQVIEEPTQVTASTETPIDHIYTTHPQHVRASTVGSLSASDHFPVAMSKKQNFCFGQHVMRNHLPILPKLWWERFSGWSCCDTLVRFWHIQWHWRHAGCMEAALYRGVQQACPYKTVSHEAPEAAWLALWGHCDSNAHQEWAWISLQVDPVQALA